MNIVINVDEEYPNTIPEFSVMAEDLKRERITDLKLKVKDACKDFIGQPMLIALVSVIREHLEMTDNEMETLTLESAKTRCDKNANSNDSGGKGTALLHIDHMRSRTNYCKTLEKWTRDLNLKGRLLFCRRLILLILQGKSHSIKVTSIVFCVGDLAIAFGLSEIIIRHPH